METRLHLTTLLPHQRFYLLIIISLGDEIKRLSSTESDAMRSSSTAMENFLPNPHSVFRQHMYIYKDNRCSLKFKCLKTRWHFIVLVIFSFDNHHHHHHRIVAYN